MQDCEHTLMSEICLKKHGKMHALGLKVKLYHYYNNSMECPFKIIGCKFRHEDDPKCRFKEKSKWNLCQYKHDIQTTSVSRTYKTNMNKSS